ncbi:MAG: 30S ribosomal protein S20 [Rickettsiales bacterium]|jgi:small subunit ribosomal protein S20|nr:30S ribosomal protein S20 [Rickettsiales bacterium]
MAHTLTAKKNIRVTARRSAVNRSRKQRIKTFLRRAEEAIVGGNTQTVRERIVEFESELMKGVSKNAYRKGTAIRKLRNLNRKAKRGQVA